MEDIKNCPFCGSDETYVNAKYGRYGYYVFCKCDLCDATAKTFALKSKELPDDWAESLAAKKAITAWNRRANDAK
jgi:Lar family restriction alleviation protein